MKFVPSPIPVHYKLMYSATANKSGRMQYHKVLPGRSKTRIGRNDFIEAYNTSQIIAINLLQDKQNPLLFQFEFFV
ncbi:MAG: hypothetical protein R2820_04480 [Cyclobacteriaceae bacterium]|nr:hypothetical protein [Cyclobacteriaceae bacterium]